MAFEGPAARVRTGSADLRQREGPARAGPASQNEGASR